MFEPTAAPRVRATIAYDGTAFHGSQLQPDVRTVQGDVESALARLFDRPVRIDLAGRTDTGVHALAQEVAGRIKPDVHWTAVYETLKDQHPAADRIKQAYQDQMDAAQVFVLENGVLTLPEGERVIRGHEQECQQFYADR